MEAQLQAFRAASAARNVALCYHRKRREASLRIQRFLFTFILFTKGTSAGGDGEQIQTKAGQLQSKDGARSGDGGGARFVGCGISGMDADEMWMSLWAVEVDLLTVVLWIHGSAF